MSAGFALDPAEFVFRLGIEPLQLQQRKPAFFLRGIRERKNHRLIFIARNRFGYRKFAAVARADQPVEIAAHDRSLHGVIRGDQPLGRGKILRASSDSDSRQCPASPASS